MSEYTTAMIQCRNRNQEVSISTSKSRVRGGIACPGPCGAARIPVLAASAIAFLIVIVIGMWILSQVSEQTEEVAENSGQEVSREEYGDDWAFTVDSGVVDCIRTQNGQGAVFQANGNIYQLDGIAASAGYDALDPIWRDNPDAPQGGPKINVRPFVELALEQC